MVEAPMDVREMIERVVAYALNHGEEVVEQIKKDESKNPKFRFLFPEDPLHLVYLEALKEGKKLKNLKKESEINQVVDGKDQDNEDESEYEDVIYPPPELRLVVDKTASAVAKNGLEFQERIRENSLRDPKFSFLNPNDPYNRYYAFKVKELIDGKRYLKPLEEVEEDKTIVALRMKQQQLKLAEDDKGEENILPPPKEPEPFNFILDHPPMSALDMDIIKLTALMVAKNGHSFSESLKEREQKNYQFDFLKPQHSLYSIYTRLVDQFRIIFFPTPEMKDRLVSNIQDKYSIFDRIMQRVEYAIFEAEQKKKVEEKIKKDNEIYGSIDWHDFMVVETIEFNEQDLTIKFPEPVTLESLLKMSMAQKKSQTVSNARADAEKAAREDAEMDMEMEMEMENEELEPAATATITTAVVSPTGPLPSGIKIKKDYIPKAEQILTKAPATHYEKCPVCGVSIPANQFTEHMKVELSDPRYRAERQAMFDRHFSQTAHHVGGAGGEAGPSMASSNLVLRGDEVSRNLENLAKRRSDIFGRGMGVPGPSSTSAPNIGVSYGGGNMSSSSGVAPSSVHPNMPAPSNVNPNLPAPPPGMVYGSSAPSFPSGFRPPIMPVPPVHHQHNPVPGMAPPIAQPPVLPPRFPPPAPGLGIVGNLGIAPPGFSGLPIRPPGFMAPPPALSLPEVKRPRLSEDTAHAPAPFANSIAPPPAHPSPSSEIMATQSLGQRTSAPATPGISHATRKIIDEQEFLKSHPASEQFKIAIQTPISQGPAWNLQGAFINIDNVSTGMLVSQLKDLIQTACGLPSAKQNLAVDGIGFLKNGMTLAFHNIIPGDIIRLTIKERGGKK